MNKKDKYFGDSRYEKVWEQMKLLQIEDISTKRQDKNGTIVWRLPIRNEWKNGKFIEVASFSTGYVRNQNSCYSNFQLNKCEPSIEYWPDHEWKTLDNGDYVQEKTGKYRKFVTKKRILIPIEIERLEYLISYCLKNYYIKHANFVANGDYVPKWKHEWELEKTKSKACDELADFRNEMNNCNHPPCIEKTRNLENKLQSIIRIARH